VRTALVVAVVLVALAAPTPAAPEQPAWRQFAHVPGIVDVVKLHDGSLAVSTRSGLFAVSGTTLQPFAPAFKPVAGGEQYAVAVDAYRARGSRCSWRRDDVYVLDASAKPGIVRVRRDAQPVRFVDLPRGAFPSGIAWDDVGRFAHRLLVTSVVKDKTTVYAVDCRRRRALVVRNAPHLEGGIVVAPAGFGRFGGSLLAADELTSTIYALTPGGAVRVVARPSVRSGPDLGIESLGFARAAGQSAYLADLGAPGSPTPGTDGLLTLAPGLAPGTLLAASEGGAATVAVTCATTCAAREVASGPAETHGEGHVVFAAAP